MLKGQELINWWGEASDREKDILIAETVLGFKRIKSAPSGKVYLFPPMIAETYFDDVTDEPIDVAKGVEKYTSPDSPRRLVEEVEQKTIEMVGESRWAEMIALVTRANVFSTVRQSVACSSRASADQRCLACLLALEDQNG